MLDSFASIFSSVLQPFLLLGVGALVRALGWFKAEADSSLSMITIRVLYPCFILFHIIESPTEFNSSTFLISLIGFLSIALGFTLSSVVSRILKINKTSERSFRFCSGIFNYGFIAIPVAISVFDEGLVVKIIIFNLGVEIAIWTLGVMILSPQKVSIRGVINPPFIAVLLGLILQSFDSSSVMPSVLWQVLESIGMCSIPVGLMLIGGNFYDLLKKFEFSEGLRIEIGSLIVRNIVFPIILLSYVTYGFIPQEFDDIKKVLIIQAAMPAGIFAIVIVGNYNCDQDTAMRSIIITMLASVVTLPLWILIGKMILAT